MISSEFKLFKVFSGLCIRLVLVEARLERRESGGRSPFHTNCLALQSPEDACAPWEPYAL